MSEKRNGRIASIVRDELPAFFSSELEIPEDVFVSIVHVDISENGGKAAVIVSIFPSAGDVSEADEKRRVAKTIKLSENRATHFIRKRLGLKHTPVIRFRVVENSAT